MPGLRILTRIAIAPVLGGLLLTFGGCGSGSYPVDPEGGAKQKQARVNAYGPSGMPPSKKGATIPATNSQAAARQQSGQGGR